MAQSAAQFRKQSLLGPLQVQSQKDLKPVLTTHLFRSVHFRYSGFIRPKTAYELLLRLASPTGFEPVLPP